jgi:Tfp pilus assembly ATPase PilU
MESQIDAPALLLRMASQQATTLMIDAPSPPVFFHGDRVLGAREYAACLSEEDCKLLVHSLLSEDQKKRLDSDRSIMVAFEVPGTAKYRMTATSVEGVYSAVITASA